MHLSHVLRIVIGLVILAVVIGIRWSRASAYSDARAREHEQRRRDHQALLQHPAWHSLASALASQGIVVASGAPGPGAYGFGILMLYTPMGPAASVVDPAAVCLNAYLKGPKKIIATIDLRTGQPFVRDVFFGEWPAEAF
jgi:hypothetical protein